MQHRYNLPDILPVHMLLFTISPLTRQQMVFLHSSTATESACTLLIHNVALPRVRVMENW